MRILAVGNLYPPDVIGGYEIACRQMVEALRRRGHRVTVLTSIARTPVAAEDGVLRRLRLVEMWDDAYVRALPPAVADSDRIAATAVSSGNVAHLLDAVAAVDPDVVYFWNTYGVGGIGLALAVQLLGIPWAWHLGDYVLANLATASRSDSRRLGALLGEHLDGTWLACSDLVVRGLAQAGAPLRGDVRRIPQWYAGDTAPLRREWMPGGTLRCMAAGRLVAHKGIGLVLDALAALQASGETRWALDVYGEPVAPWLTAARARGIDGSVSFHGQLGHDDVARRYAEHDVLLMPTHSDEPFGMVALEAAAMGCVPVVPPDFGGAEWLVGGVDCITAPRDATAIADVLAGVIAGRIDLPEIAVRAARVMRTRFHVDRIAADVEAALHDAVAARRPGTASAADVHRMARLAEGLALAGASR